jgi:hypothetical protein
MNVVSENVDLLLLVFGCLDACDFAHALAVCKLWAITETSHREALWQKLTLRDYGAGEVTGWLVGKPWKVKYRVVSSRNRRASTGGRTVLQRLGGYEFGIEIRSGELDEDGAHQLIASATAKLSAASNTFLSAQMTVEPMLRSGVSIVEDQRLEGEIWFTIFARRADDGRVLLLAESSIDLSKCHVHVSDPAGSLMHAFGDCQDPYELLPLVFNERSSRSAGTRNILGQQLCVWSSRHSLCLTKDDPSIPGCALRLSRVDIALRYSLLGGNPGATDSDSEDHDSDTSSTDSATIATPVSHDMLLAMLDSPTADWA